MGKGQKMERKKIETKLAMGLLAEIVQHMQKEDYNQVLKCIAELIRNKVYDAEAMYAGAYSYFMLGDYQRAAQWVKNTLAFAPEHLKARILMGHLCLLEDCVEDAMAVYENVLEIGGNKLEAKDIEDICSIGLGYAGQKGGYIDATSYPEIAKLIGQTGKTDSMIESNSDEIIADMREENEDAETICNKVMMENKPLAYKLKMLNTFAGEYYLRGQLHDAETLLEAALKLDSANEITLRNMAMVQIGLGCKKKAEKIVAEMRIPDFMLIKMLCAN